ncbi:MAG: hypothetical protein AVDCRST_MAG20-1820 [uncultured Acidimicrobiales bacterium]|uniref:EamA domain-containing protein n=1 Tax=uncultured Acidimicrobiales bacterium TaxID=310071 RepID=A0A6J4I4T4_9ACTN|nr:MAG: hypothetical protein AVDCRST_MAG20-1820 [uncultured Acidimicrobiales bacterium]
MSPIVLALGASLFYGGADFWAAGLTRRTSPVAVTTWSQLSSGVVLMVLLLGGGQPFDAGALCWGAVAGAAGGLGLLLYYRALAAGPASVVAPLAAAGTAIPVMVGLVRGDPTSALALLGLPLIVVGITVVAFDGGDDRVSPPWGAPLRGPRDDEPRRDDTPPRAVPLALVAAGLLGVFFVLLDEGGAGQGELSVTLGVQVGGLALNAAYLVATRQSAAELAVPGRLLVALVLLGGLNLGGDASLTFALGAGALGVVSVLTSLSPVLTAVLAWVVLRERAPRIQLVGVGVAFLGVLLVASG